jgi:hypothetical protein
MLNKKSSKLLLGLSLLFSLNAFAEEVKVENLTTLTKIETVKPSEELIVLKSTLGLINFEPTGKSVFTPTKTIPFVEKQAYGWIIKLNSNKKIKWREEVTFPETPSLALITSKKLKINTDGKTAVFEKEVTPNNGVIHHQWTISKDDMKGKYIVKIFTEDNLLKSFEFTIK